jgi:hypothetical protein
MITVFTTAKPFVGQIKTNQINAIKSWKQLEPDIEILLFGQGEGYSEVSRELGLVWIERVGISNYGTPLITSMFELAQQKGRYPTQLYINCDIILLCNIPEILQKINKKHFLAVGQRWDIDLNEEIEFNNPNWKSSLQSRVFQDATLRPPQGSDYFLYHGNIWVKLPTLVVGRVGYDNYLIYYCRSRGIPVVDLTEMITAVHQNHDYKHHPDGYQGICYGPEAELNLRKNDKTFVFTPTDADWRISAGKLIRNYGRGNAIRYMRSLQCINQGTGWSPIISTGLSILLGVRRLGGSLRRRLRMAKL